MGVNTAVTESDSANPVILKILNGAQAGVEVVLRDGTFALGSGKDDDIQLIDVSLKAGHARLRVRDGKVEVMADQGSLRSNAGLALAPGSGWQAVEPLDVLTAGSMRFALGPPSAHWDSISDADADPSRAVPQAPPGRGTARAWLSPANLRVSALPALALLLVCLFGAWVVLGSPMRLAIGRQNTGSALEQTRAALDQFAFGRDIEAHQEVDGTVYVAGYVDTPVQRRALVNALDATGLQQRIRLWVLESLRGEVAALIKTQKYNVGFDLTSRGDLTLTGLILNPEAANHVVSMIRDDIFGLHAVDSRIRTAPDLLVDVRKLLETSQLQAWLLLRLDNELIEVSGALPVAKVDAWVGFLQSFAKTYAKDIALRSFVQLQAPGGQILQAPGHAITIGAGEPGRQDTTLDVDKLRNGSFKLDDLFVGKVDDRAAQGGASAGSPARPPTAQGGGAPQAVQGQAGSGAAQAAESQRPGDAPEFGGADGAAPRGGEADGTTAAAGQAALGGGGGNGNGRSGGGASARAAGAGPAADGAPQPRPGGSAAPAPNGLNTLVLDGGQTPAEAAVRDLKGAARILVQRWRDRSLGGDPALREALDSIVTDDGVPGLGRASSLPDWFVPLLAEPTGPAKEAPCWPDALVRPRDLPSALFWLDLLSATDKQSLATRASGEQLVLLDVALNPTLVRRCADRSAAARTAVSHSLYLREIGRNASFVQFIARDLPSAQLDLSGADVTRDRFVLTRAGLKLHEGAAPDRGSRVDIVGELGVVIQRRTGLSTAIFEPGISWRIAP